MEDIVSSPALSVQSEYKTQEIETGCNSYHYSNPPDIAGIAKPRAAQFHWA